MRGAYPWQGEQQLTFREATQLLTQSESAAQVDKAKKQVAFTGKRILLTISPSAGLHVFADFGSRRKFNTRIMRTDATTHQMEKGNCPPVEW